MIRIFISLIFIQFLVLNQACSLSEQVQGFQNKHIINPVARYTSDPYQNKSTEYAEQVEQALHDRTTVCAIYYTNILKTEYVMETFPNEQEAISQGFIVTHQGKCGACSTLQDLIVYLTTDLTRPVRKCGLFNPFSRDSLYNCIQSLGFTDSCTDVWVYNTLYTKKSFIINEPFVKPNGDLNDCLQCDEDKSGPIFKYESGRTRRNSGIKSEIDRPQDQVYNMTHCYY